MATPSVMAPADPKPFVGRKGMYKAFAASLTGTALEFYDFAVYSAAAAIVFPLIFFPASDPVTGTLLAFSTYAVGYISRPVGGIIFGRLGDEIGRKKILVITLMLIGVATFLIGLLPTYDNIGVIAPAILVFLRFAQGVGVGGEWGGAVLLSSEFGDPNRRGFWASAAQIGPPAGNLMANGALAVLTLTLSEEDFLSFGWRIAFLISALLVAFGLWIRLKLEDTPIFKAMEARGDKPKAPIREVLATQRRPLIAAMLSRIGPDVSTPCAPSLRSPTASRSSASTAARCSWPSSSGQPSSSSPCRSPAPSPTASTAGWSTQSPQWPPPSGPTCSSSSSKDGPRSC